MATKGYTFEELQGGLPVEDDVPAPIVSEVPTSGYSPETFKPAKRAGRKRASLASLIGEFPEPSGITTPAGGGGNTRADRNNNPGNIKDVGQFKSLPGYKGKDDKGFAIFDSPETGFKAQEKQLQRYMSGKTFGRPLTTISQIVSKWSPVDDPENAPGSTNNYIASVSKALGKKPNEKLTEADLPKLARAMAAFEGFTGGQAPGVVVAGGSDVRPEEPKDGYTFEEMMSGAVPAGEAVEPTAPAKAEAPPGDTIVGKGMDIAARFVKSQVEDTPRIVAEKAGEVWDLLKQRIADKPGEFRGQPVRKFQMTPEQIASTTEGMNETDAKKVQEALGSVSGQDVRIPSVEEEGDAIKAAQKVRQTEVVKGFLNIIDNPTRRFLEDSLPSDFLESAIHAPDYAYAKAQEATKIIQQNDIVRHPERFPAVTVEAAKQAIAEREAREKLPKPSTQQMMKMLWEEAKADPGGVAANLVNAISENPYMVFAPEGVFLRSAVAAERGVAAASNVASRASKLASSIKSKGARMADAMATGAGGNLIIEETHAASEGEELTTSERINAALTGGVPAAALSVFTRGASAREAIKARRAGGKTLNEADLEKAMQDTAEETAVAESIVTHPERWSENNIDPTTKQRIEETLGISNLDEAQRLALVKQRKAELKEAFSPEEWNAWKVRYAESQKAIRESQAAQAAKALEEQQRRTRRLGAEYDEAELARERARSLGEEEAAYAENEFRDATTRLDEQEIFEAAMNEGVPQIRNAMLRAAGRDSKLAQPKWQRGETDPKLLTSLGAGSLFAATAYAASPDDRKLSNAFLAGLAPFLLPKGGSVLRKMKQSGAISPEGGLFDLAGFVRDGKLVPKEELRAKIDSDAKLVERAKAGDQRAFEDLFVDNYSELMRRAGRYARHGLEAEDILQETYFKAWQKLDDYEAGVVPFISWLSRMSSNAAKDMLKAKNAQKRGGGVATESLVREEGTRAGGTKEVDILEEGAGLDPEEVDFNSPENKVFRAQVRKILGGVIEKLPDTQSISWIMHRAQGKSIKEIAEITGWSEGTIKPSISRANDAVLKALRETLAEEGGRTPTQPRRSIGEIRRQKGSVDERLLQAGGALTLGAGLGIYANKEQPLAGAAAGATIAGMLMSRTKKGGTILGAGAKAADYVGGMISTRVMEKSKALWWKMHETERVILRDTHAYQQKVKPFIDMLRELPDDTQGILSRAILTGKPGVTDKLLDALGDPMLKDAWKDVRSVLDSVGDQLVHYKRFKKKDMDYFPRMVKDVPGLIKALGGNRGSFLEEALKKADKEAIRERGTGLSDLEKSLVINKILKEEKHRSQQPGYAKDRIIEEITPELQKFYHTPAESLDQYLRSSVEDIERAKFFGEDLQVTKDAKGNEYTNVDKSIGAVVTKLMSEGKISPDDFDQISSMLRSRWINGERAPHEVVQAAKNLSYAGLLGNPLSAATQLGDAVIQAYTQDIGSALRAVVQTITGNKKLDMKDFGLVNHIAEEFSSTTKSAKALNKIFKYSLFSGVDAFGKNVALNAAVNRLGKLAKTDEGIMKIQNKYSEYLGPGEIDQLVKDLQKGEASDLVRAVSFAELTRTQPVTRLELPQAYLDNPNGRVLYQYKTFALKQIDVARRDGLNEIRKGNRAQGVRKLAELGIALGVAGASTGVIKDFIMNGALALTGNETKEIDVELEDIPMNAMKTFGLTQYMMDHTFGVSKEEARERRAEGDKNARAIKADPMGALTPSVPPAKMFMDIARADPRSLRYLPFIGPFAYELYKAEEAK